VQNRGGVGLREPLCALDAAKIRMLVSLVTKDRQPWMKWIERKLERVAERWGVAEAMAAKPKKKQIKELKETCIVESTLKIWFEIGGKGGGGRREERNEKGEVTEIELSGLGIAETGGEWTPLERLKTRQTYDRLIQTRMKLRDYTPKTSHKIIQTIQKMLTADERNYWWRLAHRVTPLKKRESKWKKEKNGEAVSSTCPVCKEEEENWDHYDYECKGVREMNKRVAERVGRKQEFSREEWCLEEEGMERQVMLNIAKARWIYHCERCKMDLKQRKRLRIETLMNRLNRRIKIVTEQQK
jgi:hypothetical protein